MGSIEGHRALVTGGASGIGRAIATALAERGARVGLLDIDKARLHQTSEALGASCALALEVDVADSRAVRNAFDRVRDDWGGLEILVCSAGYMELPPQVQERARRIAEEVLSGRGFRTPMDATIDLDDALWRRTIEVHLGGTFFCNREALRLMTPLRYGRIVNLSSIGALDGFAGVPHHSAAAGGILAFTRSVAREIMPFGVTVNAIAPGWIETPMLAQLDSFLRQSTLARIPLSRFGQPEEVVPAALMLVDPDNSYMTGQVLSPNGGSVY